MPCQTFAWLSQCGFCTPGQVMSLYSLLRERGPGAELGLEEIEERFDGNICRCTGAPDFSWKRGLCRQ
eukprot:SAG11_NODE_3350_length_2507_cov_3.084302_5_plen_68_part_00